VVGSRILCVPVRLWDSDRKIRSRHIIATMSSSPSRDSLDPDALRLDRHDPYLRVLCVNVFVRDQDRSLRFYVDQFGFGLVVDESYESGGRWVAVAPPDGNTSGAYYTQAQSRGIQANWPLQACCACY
jgi:hypothetical protein